jgi:hypothetical protein
MRLIFWWLGPFLARRVYRANPLWWPVWWIASRWGRGPATALLGWTGRKLSTFVNGHLDRRMDEHRARSAASTEYATGQPAVPDQSPP